LPEKTANGQPAEARSPNGNAQPPTHADYPLGIAQTVNIKMNQFINHTVKLEFPNDSTSRL
jgi:hypothetical protein